MGEGVVWEAKTLMVALRGLTTADPMQGLSVSSAISREIDLVDPNGDTHALVGIFAA